MQHFHASRCEKDFFAELLEQGDAGVVCQLLDLGRHCRLRQVELFGGS